MAGLTADEKPLSAALLFFAVAWPYYLNDIYLIALTGSSNLTLLWILDVLFYLLIPATTLVVLYRRGKLDHVRDALKLPKARAVLWMAPLAFVLAICTHIIFTLHIGPWLRYHGCCPLCGSYPFPPQEPWHLLTIGYAALSAGVMEESIFRAHLMTLLDRVLTPRLKTPLQSKAVVFLSGCVLFALIHWCEGPGKFAQTFLIALIPTAIYMRSKNIWFLILWHTMHDALAMIAQA